MLLGTCYRIHERLKVEILSMYHCATKSVEPLIFSPFFGRSQSYLNGISKFWRSSEKILKMCRFPTPTHLAVKKKKKEKKNGAYCLLAYNEVNLTIFKILRHKRIGMRRVTYCLDTTVEPVLSSTVLSGHPILSSRLSKSRICFPLSL